VKFSEVTIDQVLIVQNFTECFSGSMQFHPRGERCG
jgi:hypothetical protein